MTDFDLTCTNAAVAIIISSTFGHRGMDGKRWLVTAIKGCPEGLNLKRSVDFIYTSWSL